MTDPPLSAADLLVNDPTSVYRLVFETAPHHVSISRLVDGTYIDVNPGFERFSGYSRVEVIGRTSVELGIWKDAASRASFVERIRREGSVESFVTQLCRRGGAVRDVEMSATVTQLGAELVLIIVVLDVTERKQSIGAFTQRCEHLERELAERTQALRVAQDALQAARPAAP